MKKIMMFALMAMSLWGAPYGVGMRVSSLDLSDQFGEKHPLKTMPKTLIMVFEKETAAAVNEYLVVQEKNYLSTHNSLLIADISQMPSFVAEAFALPKLRKLPHSVLLIRDEEEGLKFPAQEGKITVMKFADDTITSITFLSSIAELKEVIEQ